MSYSISTSRRCAAEDLIDFNSQIQPILNQHCVSCHGGVKQAGDISFVYADQALTVIEPGAPDESYFIDRVTSTDEDDRMPPADHGRALNDQEIDLLRTWIAQGAKWGEHWAFVAPEKVSPPQLADDQWSKTPVDPFVLARLRGAKLEPSVEAEPDRWLRRVSLDLTGLPPTPAERSEFLEAVNNVGEEAYRAAVDRLLASESFGERWASVWLDLVRYADSKGLGQDGRRSIWKYRDWVIKAFNSDLPFDQFTIKQIAGDLLPNAQIDDYVATACQRLTQTNEEGGTDDEQFRVEAVIDRINTNWQTWQGLTFGCVQCHSHPYDPIRHEEFYTFMAFFNNTADCDLDNDAPNLNVPLSDADLNHASEIDAELNKLKLDFWNSAYATVTDKADWEFLSDFSVSSNNTTQVETVTVDGVAEYRTRGTVAKSTTILVDAPLKQDLNSITALRFTGLPENEAQALLDAEWGFVISHFQAELIHPDSEQPVQLELAYVVADEPFPLLDPQRSLDAKNDRGFGPFSKMTNPRSVVFVLPEAVTVAPDSRIRISVAQNVFELGAFPLVAHRGRFAVSDSSEITQWWNSADRNELQARLTELESERRRIKSVPTPIMQERQSHLTRQSHVFDRGNFSSKSTRVYPGIPQFLPPLTTDSQPTRLDLAKWIASSENPLTSRVWVNRVWAQLFGIGIVETQEDFGSSGDPPSHPELLDDIAARFASDMNWSLKSLLRELTLSATYRQSSMANDHLLEADPRNRLLSRGPRVRLPAETIRDQALAISGLLSPNLFGPPVHPPLPEGVWMPFQAGDRWNTPGKQDPDRYRRTIYTYTKRTIPFPVMASFDAPSREFCAPRRLESNTPLQALMTLNDATFVEANQAFAKRMRAAGDSLDEQLRFGVIAATCREPSEAELKELESLFIALRDAGDNQGEIDLSFESDPLEKVAGVLLNLDEVLTK